MVSPREFTIIIEDNFHDHYPDEQYSGGEFITEESVLKRATEIIDEFLLNQYMPDMTSEQLYSLYCAFGDYPRIVPDIGFLPYAYARIRSREICKNDA